MSEWNEQGEECECGSSTRHERIPGCASPVRVACPVCAAGSPPLHLCPDGSLRGLVPLSSDFPDVLRMHRARQQFSTLPLEAQEHAVGAGMAYVAKREMVRAPPSPGSCWQCERSLGTGPDACLTCTAKRAEDRARGQG